MPTITTVDATWDTGVSMDAAELRRADTAMFLGDGTANGVRGGIVRHGDTSLAVTVNGSDQIIIQPGAWVIPAATGLGVYRGALQAAVGPSAGTAITARNATNPRIDLVVVQAPGIVKTIDGTPGASPVAPALPAQHIELARITVPAVGGGAVTVDSSWRAYATSLGGTLYVETAARLPGSGNQKGQRALALDSGQAHFWSGTAWRMEGSYANYTPTWASSGTAPALGNGVLTGRWCRIGTFIHFRIGLTFGSTTTAGTGFYRFTLPTAMMGDVNGPLGTASLFNSGVATLPAFPLLYDGGGTALYLVDTAGNTVSGTSPFTFSNGKSILISGYYEATAA